MKLVPTILTESMSTFHQQLESVRGSQLIETIHVDVIDGFFVDNNTVTPLDLTLTEFEPFKLDFHFMVEEPMDFVYECEAIKEYLPIRRIIGQVERMSHQLDFVTEVKRNGWEASLGLDIFTPIESIEEGVWPEIHHVLLMGVEAGAQGKPLHPHIFEKIKELRQKIPNSRDLHISVDGGVKLINADSLVRAGADELDVGSALWKTSNPVETILDFYKVVKN